jgi:hypothetical protein
MAARRFLKEEGLPASLTAFVTSQDFAGSVIGGGKSADTICQDLARNAGLEGRFVAWLSDEVDGPASTRLGIDKEFLYALIDGEEVADSRILREKGPGAHHIRKDENGNAKFGFVWTGTIAGSDAEAVAVGATCSNWGNDTKGGSKFGTVSETENIGLVGLIPSNGDSLKTWSSRATRPCNERYPIYCFQQTEESSGLSDPQAD